MRAPLRSGLIALITGVLLAAPVAAASAQEDSDRRDSSRDSSRGSFDDRRNRLDIVGLVDGTKLVSFRSDSTRIGDNRDRRGGGSLDVRGLSGDTRLVGIDYRVQDGRLYGVGNAGGVYSIDDRGRAQKVKQLTVALNGSNFGVDFNPAANALRVISDSGQNLRQPFADLNAATIADGGLNYGGTPAAGVAGAAYTNNDLDPNTATVLFDLDTNRDQLATQNPPNNGTLVPTGPLGVNAGADAGLDIYSTVRNGTTVDLMAFATIRVGNQYSLYRISLSDGRANRVGGFDRNVTDIAIPLNQL
ncbi:hypothetical protein GCM10017691_46500 [Pseudonocardia petroleophila]|uniref:DUF4394 domain-containing protein n=1 Tax=Pseudonocardia petroleophila TaxID=37331 RepID=A0A7G7MQT1_9PSEU|nr:DUF4394 domain-containing protein [Pseudonocardia petroleophila]QNG55142.1 DUF4394 domain-containing protein [Pseudonocardia petroleophila]